MLSSESLEVGEMLQAAMRGRYGDAGLPERFRAFDTICSATQDRQDAVKALLDEQPGRPDGRDWRPQQQQHVQPGANLRRAGADLSHRGSGRSAVSEWRSGTSRLDGRQEVTTTGWLPPGKVTIGLTSGASTPDNLVDAAIRRLDRIANAGYVASLNPVTRLE